MYPRISILIPMRTRIAARIVPLAFTLLASPAFAHAQAGVRPVWPDEGPLTWTPRPTSADITADDLRTRLYQFADDSMRGRRVGELGNFTGTEYIAREFQRLGLRPAGENGTYFQTLPYGPTAFDSAASRLSVGRTTLAIVRDWIPITPSAANAYAVRAQLDNVQTVFAGVWGNASVTLDPARFRGKVAVFVDTSSATPAGRGGGAEWVTLWRLPGRSCAATSRRPWAG